jgi:hypothetical protein
VTLVRSADGALLPLDTTAGFLAAHPGMALRAGERDMAVMQHELRAELPDGSVELHSSSLLEFAREENGVPVTAMARTVGLCAGAAAALLLDGGGGSISGVLTPTTPALYGPLLETLRKEGVELHESVRVAGR